MTSKELRKLLDKLPDDAELVISKPFVIDKKDKITAILDIPIVGVAVNKNCKIDNNELRFILRFKDVKACFKPGEVKMV